MRALDNLSQNTEMLIAYSLNQRFVILQTNYTSLLSTIQSVCLLYMKHAFKITKAAVYCMLLCTSVPELWTRISGAKQAIMCLPAILTDAPDVTLQTSTSGPVLSIQLQDNPADLSKTAATWKPKLKSWFSFALL